MPLSKRGSVTLYKIGYPGIKIDWPKFGPSNPTNSYSLEATYGVGKKYMDEYHCGYERVAGYLLTELEKIWDNPELVLYYKHLLESAERNHPDYKYTKQEYERFDKIIDGFAAFMKAAKQYDRGVK